MVYQGSKAKLAKYLIPIIQDYITKYNIDTYVECFVGGANLIDKVNCPNRYGFDINPYVISLLKYAQNNPNIDIAPEDCTFEHYKDVRDSYNKHDNRYSTEYIALIGYMASYAGRYFDGGYGRDSKGGRCIYKERLQNLKLQAPNLNNIHFDVMNYEDLDISKYKNCLFYLDPPYKSTKKYGKQVVDYDKFYDFCRELSKENVVLISEYNMPDDFKCIWQKERKVLQKSDRVTGDIAIEKLFTIGEKNV